MKSNALTGFLSDKQTWLTTFLSDRDEGQKGSLRVLLSNQGPVLWLLFPGVPAGWGISRLAHTGMRRLCQWFGKELRAKGLGGSEAEYCG